MHKIQDGARVWSQMWRKAGIFKKKNLLKRKKAHKRILKRSFYSKFSLVTFEGVRLFPCFLKKCSNAFIWVMSLYSKGESITESPGMQRKSCFIQKKNKKTTKSIYTHIVSAIILSWPTKNPPNKQNIARTDTFLQRCGEVDKAGTHCTCSISEPCLRSRWSCEWPRLVKQWICKRAENLA